MIYSNQEGVQIMFAGDAVQELSEDQLAYVQKECINQFSKLQSEAFEQGLVPPTKFEIELLPPVIEAAELINLDSQIVEEIAERRRRSLEEVSSRFISCRFHEIIRPLLNLSKFYFVMDSVTEIPAQNCFIKENLFS